MDGLRHWSLTTHYLTYCTTVYFDYLYQILLAAILVYIPTTQVRKSCLIVALSEQFFSAFISWKKKTKLQLFTTATTATAKYSYGYVLQASYYSESDTRRSGRSAEWNVTIERTGYTLSSFGFPLLIQKIDQSSRWIECNQAPCYDLYGRIC